MSLEAVAKLTVPKPVIRKTERALRRAGREGYEMFVLWSGVAEGDRLVVKTPHLPRQSSYQTKRGLFVRVEGEALHQLNAWLYRNREILAAQVHAHPSDAFHSETDDAYPIVTSLGGFSIVAADFARKGLLTNRTAVFRLTPHGWEETAPRVIEVADGAP